MFALRASISSSIAVAAFLSGFLLLAPTRDVLAQALPGSAVPGTTLGNIHFDEKGTMTLDSGVTIHGTAVAGGGIDYTLPGPVVPGALLIFGTSDMLVTGAPGVSDRLDFSVDANGAGHMLYRSLLDDTDGAADPADVRAFPTTDTTNTLQEVGPEGNNSFIYQTSGAIYYGVSDAVPEPAAGVLLGVAALAFVGRRTRAMLPPAAR